MPNGDYSTKRTWTYVGIDKTVKRVIVRSDRALIAFNPAATGLEYTRLVRGIHTFPIDIWVPEGCPSSIERAPANNPYLKVHYKIIYNLDVVVGEDKLLKHYPIGNTLLNDE